MLSPSTDRVRRVYFDPDARLGPGVYLSPGRFPHLRGGYANPLHRFMVQGDRCPAPPMEGGMHHTIRKPGGAE